MADTACSCESCPNASDGSGRPYCFDCYIADRGKRPHKHDAAARAYAASKPAFEAHYERGEPGEQVIARPRQAQVSAANQRPWGRIPKED